MDGLVQDIKTLCGLINTVTARVAVDFATKDDVAYDSSVFCLRQLVLVASTMDVAHDQAGRLALASSLLAVVSQQATCDDVIDPIVLALYQAADSESVWLNQVGFFPGKKMDLLSLDSRMNTHFFYAKTLDFQHY